MSDSKERGTAVEPWVGSGDLSLVFGNIAPGRFPNAPPTASANALARALRVPSGRIVDILNCNARSRLRPRRRLGRYFGNAPQFWINVQAQYDLAIAMRDVGRLVEREVQTAA
jgi:antitoxin HigA-1